MNDQFPFGGLVTLDQLVSTIMEKPEMLSRALDQMRKFHDLTIRDVQRAAGMTPSVAYRLFGSANEKAAIGAVILALRVMGYKLVVVPDHDARAQRLRSQQDREDSDE